LTQRLARPPRDEPGATLVPCVVMQAFDTPHGPQRLFRRNPCVCVGAVQHNDYYRTLGGFLGADRELGAGMFATPPPLGERCI